jgi:hypothetical protein
MLVCDFCLLNLAILVVSGLSEVLGTLGRILLSYLVHMHSRLRSLRRGGPNNLGGSATTDMPPCLRYKNYFFLIFIRPAGIW